MHSSQTSTNGRRRIGTAPLVSFATATACLIVGLSGYITNRTTQSDSPLDALLIVAGFYTLLGVVSWLRAARPGDEDDSRDPATTRTGSSNSGTDPSLDRESRIQHNAPCVLRVVGRIDEAQREPLTSHHDFSRHTPSETLRWRRRF